MKSLSIIAFAVLAGAAVAPVFAVGPAFDKAVLTASRNSKASLADICKATFDAVKETPDEADKVFESVLAQRSDWKAGDVYAIFRSVLLARPDLSAEVGSLVANRTKNGKNGFDGADASNESGLTDAITDSSVSVSPMLGRLVNTLYESALPADVAENALNMVVSSVAGVYGYSYNSVHAQPGVNTNAEGPAPDILIEFIPTPEDMSKN